MNIVIQADLYRYKKLRGVSGFLKGLMIPGFWYMFIIRKLSTKHKYSPFWFFYTFLRWIYGYRYGFQIPATTSIGKGLYIGHFGTVVISRNSIIGENCNVAPGVIIGQTNRGKSKGSPTLGDKVWVGAGAVLVGNIKIGSNVLIAPNSYVNHDVPSNSLVIGNPAVVKAMDNPTDGYVSHIL
jgi:serine O-acetyltransferase